MDHRRDLNNSRNNRMYYNQLKRQNENKRKRSNRRNKSFGSKEIDVKRIVWAPEGYEGFFIFLYFVIIPYIVGSIFLFFSVAGGEYDSFMKLNISAFFIVWAIGYEIVATLMLLIIFMMFLKHDDSKS